MRTGRLLGLTSDGALHVVTPDGEEISIVVDARLRAAVRGDRPRLGQLEIEMESQLRPREIQARIRAGESLEEVAQAAGVPAERIEAFAAPVLAERAHVVGVAQAAPVRRRGEAASTRGLEVTIGQRLRTASLTIDDVEWDSWKRGDGRWVVQAGYEVDGARQEALFTYDTGGRFSVAENDTARWLIEETEPTARTRRRQSDPDSEPTVDLDDELALVKATMPERGPDEYTSEPEVPDYSPAELAEVDGVYDLVAPSSEMDVLYEMISGIDEDSVRIYTDLQNPVTPREEPDQQPAQQPAVVDSEPDEPTRPAPRARRRRSKPTHQAAAQSSPVPEPEPRLAPAPSPSEPTQPPQPAPQSTPTKRRSRSKRASVPSWDEIMFGSKE
ncbi:MAG: septation protein SepH [Actinomycetia bacterium]|nr:septation protein SepH [Actinomycetes bacterium]